jgi:membrane protease YdiL (CAAX protease family)
MTHRISHSTITVLAVIGLFILRIPFLVPFIALSDTPPNWVQMVYALGTYALTAFLIWWERDHLQEFWVDLSSAVIFLCQKMLFPLGIGLFAGMWKSKALFPRPALSVLRWALIGALAAIPVQIFLVQPLSPAAQRAVDSPASLGYFFMLVLVQMTTAAVFEEPFFRGFLWGMLRRARWNDAVIWLAQAALFTLGHVYYLRTESIGPWLIRMFIPSLLLGLVAWRAKSITASIVTHGVLNASGDVLAHFGTLPSAQSLMWMAAAILACALLVVWIVEARLRRIGSPACSVKG